MTTAKKTTITTKKLNIKKHVSAKDRAATKSGYSNSYNYGFVCSVLKDLRVKSSMTRQELSERSGFSEGTIAKIESAQDAEIRISTLIIILDALGYDLFITKRKRSTSVKDKDDKQASTTA